MWACSLAYYNVAYEETHSNRVSYFRDFVCSLFPKQFFFFLLLFYSTVACVVPCGGRKMGRLYFISFGIIEPILVI